MFVCVYPMWKPNEFAACLACDEAEEGELAFVTPKMAEREIRSKLAQLEEQGAEVKTTVRIADFS